MSEQADTQTPDTIPYVAEDCAKAPTNPRWMFKLAAIMVVVFLVGAWGFWDATSVYPKRGMRHADWAKWQYLEQAKKADAEDFGVFIRESSVTDPKAELERLSETETLTKYQNEAANPSSSRSLRASMSLARKVWLDALKVVGRLDPQYTTIESPARELESLSKEWQSASSVPKPLHTLDLLFQWLIMAVCWIIGLIMLVHTVRVKAKKYSWEASSMTLTIPGNHSITPDDLEEVDKRKWDKFIVFLKIKGGHSTLAGKEISVDTYQRLYVEEWILAMEERAFGSQEDHDESNDTEQSTDQDESA